MQKSLILLLACFTLLSACQESDNTDFDQPETPALSLNITSVISQNIPRYYSATGYTNISRSIEISTSQTGTIKKLLVTEGDVIKAGDLLILLDESELLTSIKQAKSAVQTAKISLKDSNEDYKTAKRLIQSKVIPAQQFRKSQVQLNLAQSQLEQAQSELKKQQARKPYHRITSPINARVVKRWANQGDLAVIGKPLLQLEAMQGLEFETALPAKWINHIHVGESYQLKLHNIDEPITAKVSHIVHSADRITQTCLIKLSLPKKTHIESGLSGQIDFVIDKEKHQLIPESALIKKAGVLGVYRLDTSQNTLFTPVKIERPWKQYRLILSGLKVGEKVVINPPAKLRDGMPIKINAVVDK